ncbi:EAL domain-containing protein [Peribacillus sp. B-H-3]|uniref:bifunctional diguanylate cyclase/phosphodiesterase n=1 Tax=Peribacillus sp. B-H-3 TaxID=3400420 RepID=UPI003B02E241
MYSFSSFGLFDYRYLLMTVLFSVISCIIGIEASRKIRKEGMNWRTLAACSVLLAVSFWLTHFFVSVSVDLPFSVDNYQLYVALNFLICFIGSLIALKMAQFRIENEIQHILGGLFIAIVILSANISGFLVLFGDLVDIKPVFFVITLILTINVSLSIFRFLIQITHEDSFNLPRKWKYIGSAVAGISFSGIPYITIVSMLSFDAYDPSFFEEILPFLIVMIANIIMMLVPNLFGSQILLNNIQSYTSLFNNNPAAVFSVDLEGNILDTNLVATEITGYSKEELKGKHIRIFFSDAEKSAVLEYLQNVLQGNVSNIETQILGKEGTYRYVRITAVRTHINNKLIGVFGVLEDITDRKKAELQVQYMAYHDELTNLPNRRRIRMLMKEFTVKHSAFCIMLLDFDRFKRINDTFGHSFGDKLLIEVSKKLQNIINESGITSRLGGDEFLILIPATDVKTLAEQIIETFRSPLSVNGYEVLLTASMGIASYPEHSKNPNDLYKFADIAMYHSKENGANSFSVYNEEMAEETLNKLGLESDLQKALENRELLLYFQPKVHTAEDKLTGSEVLLRWNHPEKGFIPPNVFIPIAEESGMIVFLEKFVFNEVCKVLSGWKESGKDIKRVSINISLISILQEDFASYIINTLEDYKIEGHFLELEITERIVMKNEEDVNCILQTLREKGIHISIDDFGTGYSSLSYIDKLNVDILKIDQSFIRNIESNREVITAIIFLAKSLKMKVIAEGVETKKQIQLLKELGCEDVQGYYYSPPIPLKDFESSYFH